LLRATVLNGTRSITLSGLDLGRAGATGETVTRAHAALARSGVLTVGSVRAGRKAGAGDTGRVLAATNVWLPA